ncbi:MAG: hypothetical protein FWG21_05015, partial [Oscillospiraceae bacterium]|nr:hypothetical protein [Oscillospiraceae bacterium]
MTTGDRDLQAHQLSYDKIIKNTLMKSNELTIRFINGLFGESIPLDATIEWLDKESVIDRYTTIVADFYPKINGRMYSFEVEQNGSGDMAIRVFRYAIAGALLHGLITTKSQADLIF